MMITEKNPAPEQAPCMQLPQGNFCAGNCSDCIYYDRSEDYRGRYWCCKRRRWYFPSERDGCFDYRQDPHLR